MLAFRDGTVSDGEDDGNSGIEAGSTGAGKCGGGAKVRRSDISASSLIATANRASSSL